MLSRSRSRRESLPLSSISLTDLYSLEQTIGRGASSVVYRGKELKTGNTVAIKTINKLKNSWGRRKGVGVDVAGEVATMQQLSHPNIVRMLDYFNTRKEISIVMEFAWGGTLQDRIERKGAIAETEARMIVLELVNALAYLHNLGLIHRDVKAENVLMMKSRTDTSVKLSDFGMSKLHSRATSFVGTPAYIAPEMLRGGTLSYGTPVDAWALGVLVYQMLSGSLPFQGHNQTDLFAQIKAFKENFSEKNFSSVSPEAISFIRNLLCVDPAQRLTMPQCHAHEWLRPLVSLQESASRPNYMQPTQAHYHRFYDPHSDARRSRGLSMREKLVGMLEEDDLGGQRIQDMTPEQMRAALERLGASERRKRMQSSPLPSPRSKGSPNGSRSPKGSRSPGRQGSNSPKGGGSFRERRLSPNGVRKQTFRESLSVPVVVLVDDDDADNSSSNNNNNSASEGGRPVEPPQQAQQQAEGEESQGGGGNGEAAEQARAHDHNNGHGHDHGHDQGEDNKGEDNAHSDAEHAVVSARDDEGKGFDNLPNFLLSSGDEGRSEAGKGAASTRKSNKKSVGKEKKAKVGFAERIRRGSAALMGVKL